MQDKKLKKRIRPGDPDDVIRRARRLQRRIEKALYVLFDNMEARWRKTGTSKPWQAKQASRSARATLARMPRREGNIKS